MAVCFCGCGREIKGIRPRAANKVASQMRKDLALFDGLLADGLAGEDEERLRSLVTSGRPILESLRFFVHGDLARQDLDRDARGRWISEAGSVRPAVWNRTGELGFTGSGTTTVNLAYSGLRSPGTVVSVRDTGMTVNNSPRVELTVRCEPESGESFELSRKQLVSRLAIPRVGDLVEVAYDPQDRSQWVYRPIAARPGESPAAPSRLDRLSQLGELREQGVLSDEEFEEEKRRILEEP